MLGQRESQIFEDAREGNALGGELTPQRAGANTEFLRHILNPWLAVGRSEEMTFSTSAWVIPVRALRRAKTSSQYPTTNRLR